MTNTITHHEGNRLVWSPDGNKLAYITDRGLQAYVTENSYTQEETYLYLSNAAFDEVGWSPDGAHLFALRSDGKTLVYRFDGPTARVIYAMRATTIEWMQPHDFIYVPDAGGLVMVRLGAKPTEVKVAG